MTEFSKDLAKQSALALGSQTKGEEGLAEAFSEICYFLHSHPQHISSRSRKNPPDVYSTSGLNKLADKYFSSYRRSDIPKQPNTIPDEVVSIVMQTAYGYSSQECERIKQEHQHSMSAENCVGALLERYLDSVLRTQGWHWCCGDFVKAIDFVKRDSTGHWLALQIKNRDNSENSSSSAIRQGTTIQKWFRTFSKKPETNWNNLPSLMQGYGLSEQDFIAFVRTYLAEKKNETDS
jgi:hypothetical protein